MVLKSKYENNLYSKNVFLGCGLSVTHEKLVTLNSTSLKLCGPHHFSYLGPSISENFFWSLFNYCFSLSVSFSFSGAFLICMSSLLYLLSSKPLFFLYPQFLCSALSYFLFDLTGYRKEYECVKKAYNMKELYEVKSFRISPS